MQNTSRIQDQGAMCRTRLESRICNTKRVHPYLQMVSNNGGSRNLAAVHANLDALQAVGFTAGQIVQMVAHDGGSKNLAAVQGSLTELQAAGFNAEQVFKMVSHDGGSNNLTAVQANLASCRLPHVLLCLLLCLAFSADVCGLPVQVSPPSLSLCLSVSISLSLCLSSLCVRARVCARSMQRIVCCARAPAAAVL